MYYPCSENKGAAQLRGNREADLRLCFRICRLLVFPCGGSNIMLVTSSKLSVITVDSSQNFISNEFYFFMNHDEMGVQSQIL